MPASKTLRVMPLGFAVAFSLFGDLSLFAGLVTQLDAVQLSLGEVGLLLSVHRLVRIPGNLVVGAVQDRLGRRPLFLLGMLLAVLSTAAYGLVRGFWPFLVARVMWGAAWALINVCGTTMVLNLSEAHDRGRLAGQYSTWVLVGYAIGPLTGSLLTDAFNFQASMLICAGLSAVGLGVAFFGGVGQKGAGHFSPSLPLPDPVISAETPSFTRLYWRFLTRPGLLTIYLTLMAFYFSGNGVVLSTLTLLLGQSQGQMVRLGDLGLSIAGAGALFIAVRAVLAGAFALGAGRLSDGRLGRPVLLVASLTAGAVGFAAFMLASPGTPAPGNTTLGWIVLGLALNALGNGGSQALLPALMRDRVAPHELAGAMGIYAMMGDIGSTCGPAIAFWLAPLVGLGAVYALCLGLLGLAGLQFTVIWRRNK